MQKKVLLVEDNKFYFDRLQRILGDKIDLVWKDTVEEAAMYFEDNLDIDLIIMDACVPGDIPTTLSLTQKIKESGFAKPIIACSGCWDYRQELMQVGATHESIKGMVFELVAELFDLGKVEEVWT